MMSDELNLIIGDLSVSSSRQEATSVFSFNFEPCNAPNVSL